MIVIGAERPCRGGGNGVGIRKFQAICFGLCVASKKEERDACLRSDQINADNTAAM